MSIKNTLDIKQHTQYTQIRRALLWKNEDLDELSVASLEFAALMVGKLTKLPADAITALLRGVTARHDTMYEDFSH